VDNDQVPDDKPDDPHISDRQLATFRQVVAENLAANLARSEAFERRATTLLGFVTAALTVLLAVAGVSAGTDVGRWTAGFAAGGVVCLLAVAVFAVRTLSPARVRLVGPDSIAELWDLQKAHPGSDEVQVLAQTLAHTIEEVDIDGVRASVLSAAHDEAEWRSRQVQIASWLVVAGLACLGLATLADIGGRMWP
jgi:hypothetical protein